MQFTRLKLFPHVLPFQAALSCVFHANTWQTAGWLSLSCVKDWTCQFRNFTTDSQFYRVEVWNSHDNLWFKQGILFLGSSHIEYSSKHILDSLEYSSKHILEGRTHDLASWVGSYHCRFTIAVFDSPVKTQHITNHPQTYCESSSHIDVTELPSCVWTFSCVETQSFPILVKMLMEGNEQTFCVTLTNREQTLSRQFWIKSFWSVQ